MAAVAPILGNIAINLAIGLASSVISNALRPKQTINTGTGSGAGISFEIDLGEERPVSAIVGEHPTAGHLLYANQYGVNDEYIQLKIDIGHGEHDGLSKLYVDEKPMTLTGSNSDPKGMVVEEYKDPSGNPTLWIKTYKGVPGQVADPELIARANPASRWGTNHTATGIAYHVITMKTDADTFGSTIPKFRFVWRGLKLYDWRKDSSQPGGSGIQRWTDPTTYAFSKNLYVIRWNFRRGFFVNSVRTVGLGFAEIFNDIDYYTAAANLADESLTDPDTGTTYLRYEYGRELKDTDEPLSILREMDDAGCGGSFARGGADAPVPAQQLISVMTLEDKHRLVGHPVQADKFGAVSAKKTFWHGNFLSADEGWQMSPYPPHKSASLETLVGRREQPFHQPFESITERAQMRAEINLRRDLFPATRAETFGPRAIVLQPGDAITRICEWGSMLMVVTSVERLKGNQGARLALREWSNSIVPLSGQSFVTQPGVGGTLPAAPNRTLVVSSLSVTPFQRAGTGGAQQPYARASWALITDPNVEQVLIRVWPSAGSEANDAEDYFAGARLTAAKNFGPLRANTAYDYKAIPIRSDGRTCTWSSVGTFTSGSDISSSVSPLSVQFEHLATEVEDLVVRNAAQTRELLELYARLDDASADEFWSKFSDVQTLRTELTSISGTITASYNQAIFDATGPTSSIVGRLETLELIDPSIFATLGVTDAISLRLDDGATGLVASADAITALEGSFGYQSGSAIFRMNTSGTPSAGWNVAITLEGRVSSVDSYHYGGLTIEINNLIARTILDGDQVVVRAGGVIAALFESGTTYIETARIHNLVTTNLTAGAINLGTIGSLSSVITSLIATNAVTSAAITSPSGTANITETETVRATLSFTTNAGMVILDASAYIGFWTPASSAFGDVRLRIKKGATVLSERTVKVDDSASGMETWFASDNSPGIGTNTYTITVQAIGPGATYQHYTSQCALRAMGGKR